MEAISAHGIDIGGEFYQIINSILVKLIPPGSSGREREVPVGAIQLLIIYHFTLAALLYGKAFSLWR